MKLEDIKHIEISSFSLYKELYIYLTSNRTKLNISKEEIKTIINNSLLIQRELFNFKFGTLEQIAVFIFSIFTRVDEINIEIKNRNDLLLFVILRTLGIKFIFNLNIDSFITQQHSNNNDIILNIEESINILKENISHHNIINIIELLSRLYIPNKLQNIKDIILNLLNIYDNNNINKYISSNLIMHLKDNYNFENYIREEFNSIIHLNIICFDRTIFERDIFYNFDSLEFFIDNLSNKQEMKIESIYHDLENKEKWEIDQNIKRELYDNLLKLSNKVTETKDRELLQLFTEHNKILSKIFKR